MAHFQQGGLIHKFDSTATSGGTTTLVDSSETYQIFTGTSAHSVVLPDATTLVNGRSFIIVNRSTVAITVKYDDASTAAAMGSNSQRVFFLTDNSTTNGTWDIWSAPSAGGGGMDSQSQIASTSAVTYSDSTISVFTFHAVDFDVDGIWSIGGQIGTIVNDGYYFGRGYIIWDSNASGYREIVYRINAGSWIAVSQIAALGGGFVTIQPFCFDTGYLTNGDTIELGVQQGSGGNLNVNADSKFAFCR